MKKPNASIFRMYDPTTYTLIPLHRPDAISTKTNKKTGKKITGKDGKPVTFKDGKRPIHFNWTTQKYETKKVIAECESRGLNAGVRLRSNQVVIDIDPRNGGDEGFTDLCLDLGLDTAKWPCVITGSGGRHYYLSKPADVLVVDTLKDYPGVEFKSKGRQVVAAGSVHPDTNEFYKFDDKQPGLDSPCSIPDAFLRIITRPQRSTSFGGGQYDQETIAKLLGALDVFAFKDESEWRKVMMACHDASNGDARHEFIEWSCGDPDYSDQAEIIGRRWDSLHADSNKERITYKTLNHFVTEAGGAGLIPPKFVEDDEFPDDGEFDSEDDSQPSEAKKSKDPFDGDDEESDDGTDVPRNNILLDELNEKYAAVIEGGKFKIMYRERDDLLKRENWERISPQDFQLLYCNKRVQDAEDPRKTIPLGKAWISWPLRNQFEGVTFDPERVQEKKLNLWTGWGLEPSAKGSWKLLDELISEVLCDGDARVYEYVMNWIRHMFQHPGSQAETALVFRGDLGTGKGTLGTLLTMLCGRHALAIASAQSLTGRFNAHLQDTVFLFGDEAIKPYDKESESRLKHIITEPHISYEGKGRDIVTGKNCLHIMLASNEDWVIPAAINERRFLVSDVNRNWQVDQKNQFCDNKARFIALRKELYANDNAGAKRFLFDMLSQPLPAGWHPRYNIPTTKALVNQKLQNLNPLERFFFNALTDGGLPFQVMGGPWHKKPVRFFVSDFRTEFAAWCTQNKINPGSMGRWSTHLVTREYRKIFPEANTRLRCLIPDDREGELISGQYDGRLQAFDLPTLRDCRTRFDELLGDPFEWESDSEQKNQEQDEDFG